MVQRLWLGVLLLAFVGCTIGEEFGPSKEKSWVEQEVTLPFTGEPEEAIVINLIHSQAFHGGDAHGQTITHLRASSCDGCADGEFIIGAPEWYAIVFRCAHGQFIVQDDQEQAKELYGRLREGQKVMVHYAPTITATIKDPDGSGVPFTTTPQFTVEDIVAIRDF